MSLIPDLDKARRLLAARPPPGQALHVGVVGAHYYGFPSEDSDIDLKGVHLAPTEALLGLGSPRETHDVLDVFEGVEHDLTTHEAAKAFSLLLRGNGNVLERIASPLQLIEGEALDELRELARGALSRRFIGHYRGYFGGMKREHEREPRAKSLLYAYRVALTGAHLLRCGEVVGDVRALAPEYGFGDVDELVDLKRHSGERAVLPAALDAHHRGRWPALEQALADALEESPLPDEAPNRDAIDGWLVARRLAWLS